MTYILKFTEENNIASLIIKRYKIKFEKKINLTHIIFPNLISKIRRTTHLKFKNPHRYRAFSLQQPAVLFPYQILGIKTVRNIQIDPQQQRFGQKS